MHVRVDQIKCKSIGICVMECPEIFQFQWGSKKAMAVVDEVPRTLEDKCLAVAKKCPENAIIITP